MTPPTNHCPDRGHEESFLDRNEDQLRDNHRMALMYGHVDDKRDAGEMDAIRECVAHLRDRAADGDL